MKQRFLLILLLVTFYGYSQDKEFGVMIGVTNYMGDLTNTPVKMKETKFSTGLLFRYYFNPRLNLKANFFYGEIGGADSLKPGNYDNNRQGSDGKWAKFRNLSFKSYILDASLELELNILPYVSGNDKRNWTPYVLGGITVFSFDPKAKYQGKWYRLQPLGTEGQGTNSPNATPKYKLTQFAIPYGIGFKYSFKEHKGKSKFDLFLWNVGFEISNRKTFTDHLDDVGGYYPDYDILMASRGTVDGPIAVALSDRQAEAISRYYNLNDPTGPAVAGRDPGTPRGNINKKDQYVLMVVTITKTFRAKSCTNF